MLIIGLLNFLIFTQNIVLCWDSFPEGNNDFNLTVNCLVNCKPIDVNNEILLQVMCAGKCKGIKYKWKLSPKQERSNRRNLQSVGSFLNLNPKFIRDLDNFAVTAKAIGKNARASYSFRKQGDIKLICFENCNPSNSTQDILVKVICDNCGDISNGTAHFEPTKFCEYQKPPCVVLEQNKTMIRVKGGTLLPRAKDELVFNSGLKVNLTISTLGSGISVKCLTNCIYDISQETTFTVNCYADCELSNDYQVEWTLTPPVIGVVTEGTFNDTLKVPANNFVDGKSVTISGKRGPNAILEKFYVEPSVTNCTLKPLKGLTSTLFKVSCSSKGQVTVFQKPKNSVGKGKQIFKGELGEGFKIEAGEWTLSAVVDKNTFEYNVVVLVDEESKYEDVLEHANQALNEVENMTDVKSKKHLLRHASANVTAAAPFLSPLKVLPFLLRAAQSDASIDAVTLDLLAESLKIEVDKLVNNLQLYSDEDLKNAANLSMVIASTILSDSTLVDMKNATIAEDNFDYPPYVDLDAPTIAEVEEMRYLAYWLIKTVTSLGKLGSIEAENVITNTVNMSPVTSTTIKIKDIGATVGISQKLANELAQFKDLHVQIAVFKINPFWWQGISKNINTDILMINIFDGDRLIKKLSTDIEIFLDQTSREHGFINGNLTEENHLHVHRVDLRKFSKLKVIFQFFDSSYYGFVTKWYPSFNETRSKGKLINSTDLNVLILDAGYDNVAYISVAGSTSPTKYALDISTVSCITWDGSTWDWGTSGCRVGPNTTESITHCRCNHLSLFAGSFFVPPNKITSLTGLPILVALSRGLIVAGFIVAVWAIWVALMIWAARNDRILSRRRIHTFNDQVPGDTHRYLIAVMTGIRWQAGTSAHVAIQLLGTVSHSRVHLLNCQGCCQRGGEDWYILFTPRSLGNVNAIRLFHDSFGKHPHWFCEEVIVLDLANRKQFVFLCQKWLSLIKSGFVDCIFFQTSRKNLYKGKNLFLQHIWLEVSDGHLWLSVFTRSPDNIFSSKERVSVGVAVLLLSLMASAMFYDVTDRLGPQGSFYMTKRELAIVIESLLITLPLGVLLTVLFRKSGPIPRYVITELLQSDLHKIIVSPQHLSADHIKVFLYQILRGLKYLHSARILHRDIKPGNLLVNSNCILKICDFGLARVEEPDAARAMTQEVVTQYYRAPEILMGARHYSAAVDVWSVGCIFGELLGRRILFQAQSPVQQLELITELLGTPSLEDMRQACEGARTHMLRRPVKLPSLSALYTLSPQATHEAVHLLCQMLVFDPLKRISVVDALAHPYLDEGRLRYHSCMCKCCAVPTAGVRRYTAEFEPKAPNSFDDVWERRLSSVMHVKEEMHTFIAEHLNTSGRVPLCINPQSAAFKSFASSSVAHTAELPPSPQQWH